MKHFLFACKLCIVRLVVPPMYTAVVLFPSNPFPSSLAGNFVSLTPRSRSHEAKALSLVPLSLSVELVLRIRGSCAVKRPQRRQGSGGQRRKGTPRTPAKRNPSLLHRWRSCPSCLPLRCTCVAGTSLPPHHCESHLPRERRLWPVSGFNKRGPGSRIRASVSRNFVSFLSQRQGDDSPCLLCLTVPSWRENSMEPLGEDAANDIPEVRQESETQSL